MAVLTRSPAAVSAVRTLAGRVGRPSGGRLGGTPARLSAMMLVLVAVGLAAGIVSVIDVVQRSATVNRVTTGSGPLTVRAQQLYRALSDADATAASAFLAGGQEPAALRQRYTNDIAAATAALSAATAADGAQPTVGRIAAQLPVYTGLVETARTYNRQNLPVGAAYQREASALMRTQLLVAAKDLYDAETAQVEADRRAASGFPWLAVSLLLLGIGGLVAAQAHLTRRTNRLFNPGLLAATALAVALFAWLVLSCNGVRAELSAAQRDGSGQVQLLAQARLDALQARADESLTLVARGNGGDFETDYKAADGRLTGVLARARDAATDPAVRSLVGSATTDAGTWRKAHTDVRAADDGGRYGDAVSIANGAGQDAFNRVDTDLAKGIALTNDAFNRRAHAAAGALGGAAVGLSLLTVLLLAGLVYGFEQRIAEYR
jgi:hypothetical protein